MSSSTSLSTAYTHKYAGNGWEIQFAKSETGELSVTIDTETLHVRSIKESDLEYYKPLYADAKVMEKLLTGATFTAEQAAERVKVLVQKWKEGNPFSHMPVFKKDKDGQQFVGSIRLDDSEPGVVEISGLGHVDYWRKGYGTAIATLAVKEYSACLQKEGHLVMGKILSKIFATARPDNPGSVGVLKKLGMSYVKSEEKYGATREFYELTLVKDA